MSTFRRIVLLGLFAAAGVGVAVAVGSSVVLSPEETPLTGGPASESSPPAERQTAALAKAEEPEPTESPGPRESLEPTEMIGQTAITGATESPGPLVPESDEISPAEPPAAPLPVSLPAPPSRVVDLAGLTSINTGVSWPGISVPSAALPAAPQPALAQEFVTEADQGSFQDLYDLVREQLVREQLAPEPRPPEESVIPLPPLPETPGGESPVAPPPAAPAVTIPEAAPPAPKTVIDEEGDGKLAIRIQDADIREVLDLLGEEGQLNILASSNVQGKVTATLRGVDLREALGAILKANGLVARREGPFLYVGTVADFDAIEQTIDGIGTRVYRPNYITSAELQSLIQPLLTEGTGVVSVSTPAEMGIASDDSSAGGNTFAGSDVVLVRDYEAVLTEIDQVVEEVDVRPVLVAIEAMILNVRLDDENQFGVNFELLRDKGNVKLGLGTPAGTLADLKFDDGGLKFGFLDGSLGAFLDAIESVGDTSVIATPRVMVLNKHRAEIQIGEEKGYISTTITETSSSQSVEFLKLGAQLRLRPFVSSDGLIRMEIHPELSDGTVDTSSGYALPNKEVTQVTTNIMIRDGHTAVIGGLMREQLSTTTTQIPLLGSLPGVGVAFRNKLETNERRELLVLITPRIIYEPELGLEGAKSAAEFHRREAVMADHMSPLGKRAVARKHFRMAQTAWAVGDRDAAMRHVELSIHYDPTNRAAIDLRSDIWAYTPRGDHTLDTDVLPSTPLPIVGETPMAGAWGLDGEGLDIHDPTTRVHPLDPGRPGSQTDILRPGKLQ